MKHGFNGQLIKLARNTFRVDNVGSNLSLPRNIFMYLQMQMPIEESQIEGELYAKTNLKGKICQSVPQIEIKGETYLNFEKLVINIFRS